MRQILKGSGQGARHHAHSGLEVAVLEEAQQTQEHVDAVDGDVRRVRESSRPITFVHVRSFARLERARARSHRRAV